MNNLKILITGGCGFIGTNLVLYLKEKYPNIKLIIIDNFEKGERKYISHLKDIKILDGDLMNNDFCLKNIKNVDCVFHLADLVPNVDYAYNNEFEVYRNNVVINSNVLNSVCLNNIKNYIYVGTSCSYTKDIQMREEGVNYVTEKDIHPLNTDTSYGFSKYLGEYEALLAQKKYNFNLGLPRFHNVYGPYCYLNNLDKMQVIPSLIYKILKYDKPLEIWGSGNQYRDFVYVSDVVEGLELIFLKGMNTGPIQFGSGYPTYVKDLPSLIDGKKKIFYNQDKKTGDFGRVSVNKKAENILNWKPKTKINEGIKETKKWMSSILL